MENKFLMPVNEKERQTIRKHNINTIKKMGGGGGGMGVGVHCLCTTLHVLMKYYSLNHQLQLLNVIIFSVLYSCLRYI